MSGFTDRQVYALVEVAEAAATLFRPPHRFLARMMDEQERHDVEQLHKALHNPACPVEIGEELT
jgi:hypothetical protein